MEKAKRKKDKIPTHERRTEKDFFYILSQRIYDRYVRKKEGQLVRSSMLTLHPGQVEESLRQFYVEKIRLSMLVLVCVVLFTIGLGIIRNREQHIVGNEIVRGAYGEAEKEVRLIAQRGEETARITYPVRARLYTQEQLTEMVDAASEHLRIHFQEQLGEGELLMQDVSFPEQLEGYPFVLTWESSNYELLSGEGRVHRENIKEEECVTVYAFFRYEDFEAQVPFFFRIAAADEKKTFPEAVEAALQDADEKTRCKERVLLPGKLQEEEIAWTEEKNRDWLYLLPGGVVLAVLLYFLRDRELLQEIKRREEQLLIDYPDIVSKLSLYLGAGMTIKGAWEKIVIDRQNRNARRGEVESRYVYEEMWIALSEMRSGMSESSAYDRFGKRCRQQMYIKLSSLLVQNLRKGSTSLGLMLQEESQMAFSVRKMTTRKRGEEAGTKLLAPMMLMLLVVMVMIMVPAFMTF